MAGAYGGGTEVVVLVDGSLWRLRPGGAVKSVRPGWSASDCGGGLFGSKGVYVTDGGERRSTRRFLFFLPDLKFVRWQRRLRWWCCEVLGIVHSVCVMHELVSLENTKLDLCCEEGIFLIRGELGISDGEGGNRNVVHVLSKVSGKDTRADWGDS